MYHDLFVITVNMEDSRGAQRVLQSDGLVFGADANMSVTEVQLLLKEVALRLSDISNAPELLICSILNFHDQGFLVDSRPGRVKKHSHLAALTRRHYIREWAWNVDLASVLPMEASRSIALVSHFQGLLDAHLCIVAIIAEVEAHNLR